MTVFRKESDSLGEINVPLDALWGAQTERSRQNFTIGSERMPYELIEALILIKKAAAIANSDLGVLEKHKKERIVEVTDELLQKKMTEQFPLVIWQTGSGTQTNMNVNEVIATLANEKAGFPHSTKSPIHPNDDVNKSQSTNDVFPSAIHLAASLQLQNRLFPALNKLHAYLFEKSTEFREIIKVGRTHLMDAAPLTLGQEFSGFATQIEEAILSLTHAKEELYALAIGGTAVGTGLNSPAGFGEKVAETIKSFTNLPFYSAKNKFALLASHDACVSVSASLKRLSLVLFKIANDIRWMGSGPRAGLAELILPINEPGSSIMPGKANPTQCEAISQVAIQVIGYDSALSFAGALGNFELNVYKPLIAYNLLQSISLLSDAIESFSEKCLKDLQANEKQISHELHNSLMLATSLNLVVGYDKAAEIVKKAHQEHKSLKAAALELGHISEEEFDKAMNIKKMVYPHQ
jgi:fumarate hydratase, class II